MAEYKWLIRQSTDSLRLSHYLCLLRQSESLSNSQICAALKQEVQQFSIERNPNRPLTWCWVNNCIYHLVSVTICVSSDSLIIKLWYFLQHWSKRCNILVFQVTQIGHRRDVDWKIVFNTSQSHCRYRGFGAGLMRKCKKHVRRR